MSPQEVLLAAADLLETEGWRQGDYGKSGEPMCVAGAIFAACPVTTIDAYLAMDRLEKKAGLPYAREGRPLIGWNDQLGQTAENVIATLRAAAQ